MSRKRRSLIGTQSLPPVSASPLDEAAPIDPTAPPEGAGRQNLADTGTVPLPPELAAPEPAPQQEAPQEQPQEAAQEAAPAAVEAAPEPPPAAPEPAPAAEAQGTPPGGKRLSDMFTPGPTDRHASWFVGTGVPAPARAEVEDSEAAPVAPRAGASPLVWGLVLVMIVGAGVVLLLVGALFALT